MLLEDPDLQARARSGHRTLIEELRPPVLFDQIRNVPELFACIRARIDQAPGAVGQWLLTRSQEAPLMRGVTESMAGRAAVLELLPFSLAETDRVSLCSAATRRCRRARRDLLCFGSHIRTYLERDVRAVTNARDLATFQRFLGLLACRHGRILNKSDPAAPLGVSISTVSDWLHVLETTAQIILVPPYFENFGKRLLRSPKVYLRDSGLA